MTGRLKEDSRAVILIITALLFPVLLAFLALALDVGKIYDLKRRTQNAANAGAIGGAYEVYRKNTAADVDQAGHEDAIKNGFDNADSNVTVTINYPYTWQGVSGYVEAHYCPVKSRIESVGWGHRVSFRGSRTAARPVKWAFSRKG